MKMPTLIIDKIRVFRERSSHWRKAHFHCARHYQRLDCVLGMSSVILSTVVLAFAFYTVNRPAIPIWAQYSLASVAVFLGMLNAVQLYHRPAALAETHRASAAGFGEMHRKWELLEVMYMKDPNQVTIENIEQILRMGDRLAKESRPIPSCILCKYGLPKEETAIVENSENN